MYYLLISVFFVCVSYHMYMKTNYKLLAILYAFVGIYICPIIMFTVPLDGYYEPEVEKIKIVSQETQIEGCGNVTVEDNVYIFGREKDSEYMLNDLYETYITESLSSDVTVEKIGGCEKPEMVIYTSKPKVKLLGWTFPILGDNKVEYVFYVPENSSVKEMKVR